jgi:TonB-dependent receptor
MKTTLNTILARLGYAGTFISTAIAMAFISSPAAAQDAAESQTAAQDEAMEEILVTGVRRSLELALVNKRNADSIMDGIAAEGIGKFPDLNLADSLSRVTGVQLSESGPSGERREGQVAVRGLPNNFSKTLVNGQTLATPNFNGGFSFGIFESDVVSAINVIKSPTAKYDEGGLSGIVDIRTLRPLSIRENFLTASVEMDYEDLSEDVVPNAAISWGQKFADDTVGVYTSLKWSDQQFRTDSARINGYDDEDTDGDGLADEYIPNEARYNSRQNEGDRLSFAGGVEFAPSDNLKIGVLGIYSAYELLNEFDQFRMRRPDEVIASDPVDGGRFGTTYTQAIFVDPEFDLESRVFDDEFESYGVTADIEWANDDWTATGVVHYSAAGYDRFAIQSRRNIDDGEGHGFEMLLDTGAGNVNGLSITGLNADWLDPAHYTYGESVTSDDPENQEWRQRFLSSTGTDRDETETALQFDIARHFDTRFISSIEGGLKYRRFEQDQRRPSWSVSGWDFSGVPDADVLRRNQGTNGAGFFGGTLGGVDGYLVPDWKQVYNILVADNPFDGPSFGGLPLRINNNRTFNTDVDISSAYLMFRFDGANLRYPIPIRGNFGVRHVRTDRNVQAYTISDLLDDGEQLSNAKADFSHSLPSLNVVWDINDDLMLRMALYKAMVRPNANSYRADSSVDVDPSDWNDPDEPADVTDVDVELGNPQLLPFEADAFDLSLEWYNREGSGISLAYFRKNIVNGIEDRLLCPDNIFDLPQLSNFDNLSQAITGDLEMVSGVCMGTATRPDINGDPVPVEVTIEDSINNQDGFRIDGWEIGLLQNFDFLPAPWDGLGVRANYTDIDTSQGPDFDNSGNRLPLENVSEQTYNLILYYDAETWGTRLAYRNRSEYFLEATGSFSGEDRFVADMDRLDFSGSWRPTDNLRIQAEIFNLTNERRVEYQGVKSRVRDLRYSGRTYTIGLRYRF